MKILRVSMLLMVVLVTACGVRPRTMVSKTPAPSDSPAQPASTATTAAREHVVVRGDTLYGIAFRNGLDHRDLARWNGIAAPFTIYPGQRLRLGAPAVASTQVPAQRSAVPAGASSGPAAAAPPRPLPVPSSVPSAAPSSVATTSSTTPVASPSGAVSGGATSTPVPAPAPVVSATPATTPAAGAATTPVLTSGGSRRVDGITWRWPSEGQVIGRYVAGDQTNQGINIAGNSGQPVLAAADGEVVYSGSGLIGYGELVIIRHSDVHLSAYGHNRKRLVAEGQKVKAGQQVAEMGRSGATRDMLHFEIRKSGKPVDPLPFLPAR